jgi:hypothetical protein
VVPPKNSFKSFLATHPFYRSPNIANYIFEFCFLLNYIYLLNFNVLKVRTGRRVEESSTQFPLFRFFTRFETRNTLTSPNDKTIVKMKKKKTPTSVLEAFQPSRPLPRATNEICDNCCDFETSLTTNTNIDRSNIIIFITTTFVINLSAILQVGLKILEIFCIRVLY